MQHNKNANLDSNFFDPANEIDTPAGIRDGQIYLSPQSPIGGGLWKEDYHDFAPRLGLPGMSRATAKPLFAVVMESATSGTSVTSRST